MTIIDWNRYIETKFGRLTAKYFKLENGSTKAICICDCGNKDVVVEATRWKAGLVLSCGCYAREQTSKRNKKYNVYDLNENFGTGITFNGNEFYFDLEDYDKIKQYCWHKHKDGYMRTCIGRENNKNKYVLMHRLILGNYDKNIRIDHINRHPYDNRKNNLRIATHSENMINRKLSSNNISGFRGVYFCKRENRWKVSFLGRHIGTFLTKEDAITTRKREEENYCKNNSVTIESDFYSVRDDQ